MTKVIGSNLAKLESSYALEITCNISQYLEYSIQTAPSCPRSGELYLFATEFPLKKDNWKYDHLKWINNSSRTCQRGKYLLKLHYFTINIGLRNRGLFFKQVYTTQVNDLYIALIYYHGNNDHAMKIPHMHRPKQISKPVESQIMPGNIATKQESDLLDQRVHNEVLYSPTRASPESTSLSGQLGNDLDVHSQAPRIENHKRQKYTLSLHQKAEQMPNLIYLITSIPKLVVVFGYNDLIQEYRHLLRTHPNTHEIKISIDVEIRMEYFYATPIYINYPRFSENPSFPVLMLVHEARSPQVYSSLFSELVELMPELQDNNFIIKLENIDVILNSAKKHLPNLNFQIADSATNTSSRDLNEELLTNMLSSTSLDPTEFVEVVGKNQKEILSEISRSYKSKGHYHLHANQSNMIPATYLNNNVYQVLKITTQSSQQQIQEVSGNGNWSENNITQIQEETGNLIVMEDKSQSSEEQTYQASIVIAEPNQFGAFISQTSSGPDSSTANQIGVQQL